MLFVDMDYGKNHVIFCLYVCIYIYIYIYKYVCISTYMDMYLCVDMYIYIYIVRLFGKYVLSSGERKAAFQSYGHPGSPIYVLWNGEHFGATSTLWFPSQLIV